ncbi:MAG TPA: ATP-dependent zinc metalloprotease FtsH [Dehalococcoidales bacterium]|nr:ATP-dependent zinc metalloprotease FtsH [Dehalococcoidales bacterium]
MRNTIIIIALLAIGFFIFYTVSNNTRPEPTVVPLSEVISLSQQNQIERIDIAGDKLTVTKKGGTEIVTYKESNTNLADLRALGLVTDNIVLAPEEPGGINWGNILLNILPIILIGVIIYFLFRSARGANNQAMRFGRSRARLFPANKPTVTFDDVAGVEEAKEELSEVVEFLKNREKFQSLGARIPKGVLLVGPPGTGKTLLAKAVAGEAGVPFFSISGSEFVEMFVGVGASRVRDLFDQAKRNAPCIVFIDEIDAVGRQRGAGLGGSHDEREQTLNQILVEMDGFDTGTTVIVLAATNRPDILDPALLRPGRFDRRVVLDAPDINGRLGILKVHSKGKPLANVTDLETIARATPGFSGADLANLINEAAILAARRNKKVIEMAELGESIDRVIAGPERKSRRITPKEKEMTAYHEAGHALVAKILPHADPVHKISIISRGRMGGYTRMLPSEDKYMATRSEYKDFLAVAMGGRVAEELIYKEMTTGAAQDMKQATDLARKMVTVYGMSDKMGPRTFGQKEEMIFLGREISEQRDYSEKTALQIDLEVSKLIDEAHQTAVRVLTEFKDRLVHIAQVLVARETLEGADMEAVLNGTELPALPAAVAANQPAPVAVPRPTPPVTAPDANPRPIPS